MNQVVDKEIRKHICALHKDMDMVLKLLDCDMPEDIIKLHFEGIRILVDYCEKLALEGETAIETLD
ncbi:hypothetical protein [Blautia sp. HCP28S3_G10]|uniref:hypothetical protein n=1 Tax=Blautia sp. HCP28S3_G10 TaxID=3438908 RepID=UPI003F88CF6C